MTVDGPQYRICGRQTDANHPDCVYYALEGQDGRRYGISVRSDGFRGPLIDLHDGTTVKPPAEPIKPGTRLNIPARCGCTGQAFVYLCRYRADGQWIMTGTDISQVVDRDAANIPMMDVHGSFVNAHDFNGCPYCRAMGFLCCCKTVSCDGMTRYKDQEDAEGDAERQYRCGACHTWSVCAERDTFDVRGQEQQPVNARKELVAQRAVIRQ